MDPDSILIKARIVSKKWHCIRSKSGEKEDYFCKVFPLIAINVYNML